MAEARDLVLARWVVRYRKAPKIAVAEALRSLQEKRQSGKDTSLAKILVERGWLSVRDLREIVGRARGEALVCKSCKGRFAMPAADAEGAGLPACPRCRTPLEMSHEGPSPSFPSTRLPGQQPAPNKELDPKLAPWPEGSAAASAALRKPRPVSESGDYDPSAWPQSPPRSLRDDEARPSEPPADVPAYKSHRLSLPERFRWDESGDPAIDAERIDPNAKTSRALDAASASAPAPPPPPPTMPKRPKRKTKSRRTRPTRRRRTTSPEADASTGLLGLSPDEIQSIAKQPTRRKKRKTKADAPLLPWPDQRAAAPPPPAAEAPPPAAAPPGQRSPDPDIGDGTGTVELPPPPEDSWTKLARGDAPTTELPAHPSDDAADEPDGAVTGDPRHRPTRAFEAFSDDEREALRGRAEARRRSDPEPIPFPKAAPPRTPSDEIDPPASDDAATTARRGAASADTPDTDLDSDVDAGAPEGRTDVGLVPESDDGVDEAAWDADAETDEEGEWEEGEWEDGEGEEGEWEEGEWEEGEEGEGEWEEDGEWEDEGAPEAEEAEPDAEPDDRAASDGSGAPGALRGLTESDEDEPSAWAASSDGGASSSHAHPALRGLTEDSDDGTGSDDFAGTSAPSTFDLRQRLAGPDALSTEVSDDDAISTEISDDGSASDALTDGSATSGEMIAAPEVEDDGELIEDEEADREFEALLKSGEEILKSGEFKPAPDDEAAESDVETPAEEKKEPEELKDPLSGRVIEGSGRFILELTSWDNVTEFLGVDVPSVEIEPEPPKTSSASGFVATVSARRLAITGERAAPPAPPGVLARLGGALRHPAVAIAVISAIAFFGYAQYRGSIEAERAQLAARARAAESEGQLSQARASLDALVALAPTDVEARVWRGRIALAQRDTAFAIADATLALAADETSWEAHALIGRAHLANARYLEATAALDRAVELADDPSVTRPAELLEDAAVASLGVSAAPRVVKLAKAARDSDAGRPIAAALLAWVAIEKNLPQRALSDLEGVDTTGPDGVAALLVRARARLLADQPEAALADLEAAVAALPPGEASPSDGIAELHAQAAIRSVHPVARGPIPRAAPGEELAHPPEPREPLATGAGVRTERLQRALDDVSRSRPFAGLVSGELPAMLRVPSVSATIGTPVDLGEASARLILKALALEGLGVERLSEARDAANGAAEADPTDGEALATAARLRLAALGIVPTRPGELRLRVDPASLDAPGRSSVNEALGAYGRALSLERAPIDRVRVHVERGAAALVAGRSQEASADAKAALEIDRESFEALLLAADAALTRGELSVARDRARRAASSLPGAPAALLREARVLAFDDRGTDADGRYNAVIERAGREPLVLAERGRVRVSIGLWEDGVSDLREALDAEPSLAIAWLALGRALAERGKPADAQEALVKAALAAPSSVEPRLAQGRFLERIGKLAEAADAYRLALEIDPDNTEANLRRCLVADEAGDADGALEATKIAMRRLSTNEALLLVRIRAYARKGDPSRADRHVRELARLAAELGSLGDAVVYMHIHGDDDDKVEWLTVKNLLADASSAIDRIDLEPDEGRFEVQALFYELRARARAATGEAGAEEDRARSEQLRGQGRPGEI